jgi:hypothetical protein
VLKQAEVAADFGFPCLGPSGTLGVIDINPHLTAPPASGALLFPRERSGISGCAKLCQICARPLLIRHIWMIWRDERTITYELSTAVGVPIPSLATCFQQFTSLQIRGFIPFHSN